MRRRSFLVASSVLATGCRGDRPAFKGIDITGAPYGRDFSLLDPQGKVRTLADFRGKVVMLFFGFTQCPDVCPTALARAAEVKKRLGPDGQKLQVIFVTVDPERDKPQMLAGYTAAFDPTFLGLYGDLAATEAAAREFKVFYRKIPTGGSYTMDHTAITYVFDAGGRLRLALRHEQTAEDYTSDIRLLMKTYHPTTAPKEAK